MYRPIKNLLFLSLLVVSTASVAVPIIDNTNPIPDQFVLLNFAGSGLDWVYAGPIGINEFGPGSLEAPSYRAAEGWRSASALEWVSHPLWDDFIVPGNPGGIVNAVSFFDHSAYIFASEYWSTFRHVDAQDFDNGLVGDGVNGVLSGVPETIYVRNGVNNPVPEPTTLALLGLGLIAMRSARRKSA